MAKSDPITFATDEIGWYAVQVNANDLATTGATPRWFLATVLLPQSIEPAEIDYIFDQMRAACVDIGATIVGGHTEVTYDLTRPIVLGTLLGTVARERLITPEGAQPDDAIILTKRLAVEATSIMAREKADELRLVFDDSVPAPLPWLLARAGYRGVARCADRTASRARSRHARSHRGRCGNGAA